MTTSISYRISAIFMVLLMLLSSTGVSIDLHYCQDQIQGISLFGEAKSCHEKQGNTACHHTKNLLPDGQKSCCHKQNEVSKTVKDKCCHNETVVIDKSDIDILPTQSGTVDIIQLNFAAASLVAYHPGYNRRADYPAFAHYKPPLPDRDVQVLYQSFRI